jgi:hypothetical protein
MIEVGVTVGKISFLVFYSKHTSMENEFTNQITSLNWTITIYRIVGWAFGLGAIFCAVMVWWQGTKVDSLRKPEKVVDLLNKLEESPADYDKILPRFLEIEVSKLHYDRFKKLHLKYEMLAQQFPIDPTTLTTRYPEYKHISNESFVLIVKLFPDDLLNDESMDDVVHQNTILQYLSSSQRRKCIDALFKSVQAKSLQRRLIPIERVLTDIVQHEPTLLDYFKTVFGGQSIEDLKKLWSKDSFSAYMMPTDMRGALVRNGLLVE